MTTRRDVPSTKWRYLLAAGRFVLPRLFDEVNVAPEQQGYQAQHQKPQHQEHQGGMWQQLKRLLLAEDAQNAAAERHSKRAALAARTQRAVSGQHHNQTTSPIKGYSGAVLATTAILQRTSHSPYDDYLGKPLIEHTLTSLEHAFERFVVAEQETPLDVARYPELMPSTRALSGLHSALSFAFQDWVAVVAYDLPHVSSYYWDYLFARRGGAPIVIAQDAGGEFVPLAALYHRSVIMQVAHLLEHDQGDLEELLSVSGATVIPWESLEVRFGRQIFTSAVAVGQPPL